jgi:Fe2+ or Zn2+ uptake regulation protein
MNAPSAPPAPRATAGLSGDRIAPRLLRALAACARAGLRLTASRRRLLEVLARQTLPVTLETLASTPEMAGHCVATTVYRTLMLFTAAGVVRQVNLRHKVSHFLLDDPDDACDYLICRCCSTISRLPPVASIERLEQQVRSLQGYTELQHELELYGVCPACRPARAHAPPTTKLPVRG